MKNDKSKRGSAAKSIKGQESVEVKSHELVDKQPQAPLEEVVPKVEKLRERRDDVNHRFGKSSGSN